MRQHKNYPYPQAISLFCSNWFQILFKTDKYLQTDDVEEESLSVPPSLDLSDEEEDRTSNEDSSSRRRRLILAMVLACLSSHRACFRFSITRFFVPG